MRSMALLLLAAGVLASARAEAHDHGPFAARTDPAIASRPTAIQSGIGRVHQKVTTGSSEAQAFYDQGLAHLHSYRWLEAARSFHQALRLDPRLAMAHLGLARAFEGLKDEAAADRELEQAKKLVENASLRERHYLSVYETKREALRATGAGRDAAHVRYKRALDALVEEDDRDVEAWLLRGNAEEGGAWGRGQGGDASSLRFYEAALRIAPDHFGAHHYIAHTYENMERPKDAARHAAIYAKAAPDVPHARHMYAHTLPRVGRWDEAVSELEAASALEESFAEREGLPASHDWHRVHNLTLLGLAYLRAGRDGDAEKTLREAFETPIPDPLVQSWHSTWPEFLLLKNRPAEALEAARTLASKDSPMSQVVGRALEGEALLDQGNPAGAAAASDAARERVLVLQNEDTKDHPRGEALLWVATEYANVLDARRALHAKPDAQWIAFVGQVGDQIAADPTFDGWGVGWLRLRRLERDARTTNHSGLATRFQAHLQRVIEPSMEPPTEPSNEK